MQFPNALRSGTIMNNGTTAQFTESVSLYDDADAVAPAFAATNAGLGCCATGNLGTEAP